MPQRCPICKAWKLGDRILRRTARTDTCSRCDPVNTPIRRRADMAANRAREAARRAEDLPRMRQWLMNAPHFSEQLLTDARAAYPRPDHSPPWTLPVLPWADTLDLDDTAGWLYSRTSGRESFWPPATDNARSLLVATYPRDHLDIGTVFDQRGFPYPPDPTRHPMIDEYGEPIVRDSISFKTGLLPAIEAQKARGGRFIYPPGSTVLPRHYTDILTLDVHVYRPRYSPSSNVPNPHWRALGSIYREDPDRVVVLWR